MPDMTSMCTCRDKKCPHNPCNHDLGCTPCIRKNLQLREIPSCFFNMVGGVEGLTSFHFEDFAKAVLAQAENNK